jgi:hypothetical protein
MKKIPENTGHARLLAQLAAKPFFRDNPARTQLLADAFLAPQRPAPPVQGELAPPPSTRVVRRAEAARARTVPPAAIPKPAPARKRDRLEKAQRAGEIYLQRVHRLLASEGVPYDVRKELSIIPRTTWVQVSALLADASGRAVRIHLKQLRNKVLAGAIKRAALCGGHFAWSDDRARAVAALGIAFASLARRTRRRGRWEFLIKGIPLGALCALLRDPWTGERPHRNTLSGTHRAGAAWDSGQVGYLNALVGAGALYKQQLPKDEAQACELLGPSGYATSRYWLVTDNPTAPMDDDEKRALLELHGVGLEAMRDVRPLRELAPHVLAELAPCVGPPTPRAPL